jgi:hypothetical protein
MGVWYRLAVTEFMDEDDDVIRLLESTDLDATDWEPRPKPVEPWEGEAWLHKTGHISEVHPLQVHPDWERHGWRRLIAREVKE